MPAAQKLLYERFFGFGLSICLRYAKSNDEAMQILNDGFVRIFRSIPGFIEPAAQEELSRLFMSWFKKIMINTGINYFKALNKASAIRVAETLDDTEGYARHTDSDQLAYDDLVKLIQKLSPAYRNTFCLYVIDGYRHEEIAGMMGISVGASKSNLLKARKNLRKMLEVANAEKV
ncbi:RNA polymerase sigma factor [Niabella sp. 22666]|uniref:RNA polymerase sigma factor n=1 Tax=Niabella sp. 22666 TaxID=3453954 RepID=UPI003F831FC3